MKFNWGHGVALVLFLFVATIVGVVVKISVDDQFDHELVSEKYYEEELKYQEEIDKVNNASLLSEAVQYKVENDGILLTFPGDLDFSTLEGVVYMQRPSKKVLDFDLPIKLDDNNQMLIPSTKVISGLWKLKIDWKTAGTEYMFKAKLNL